MEKIKEKTDIICDNCKSNHVVRHGYSITVNHGRRQRWKCQKCGHTFYAENETGNAEVQ